MKYDIKFLNLPSPFGAGPVHDSSHSQADAQASYSAVLGQVSWLFLPWVVLPCKTIKHLPAELWATVRSATCSVWFSHHNHDDFSLLSDGHKFRLWLIYFPAILTLNLTQLRGETDTMSELICL